MPQIRSAEKRLRQNERRAARNRTIRARMRTGRRAVLTAIAAGDAEKTETAFRRYCSMLDRAQVKGIVKKNFAARQKARFSARCRPAGPAQ
ncbi:MAG TPA: 30S ribosomal protein S20 [bacterium]|nr:30S ribosomal protein S20 [bacterium]HPJ72990.1 30S ribosomal protein S20 [bacterium]HPQ65826.1 30S ribosomal protein S20 [bacterium]